MKFQDVLPLALGLLMFSFIVTGIFLLPYINLLYKLRFIRKKEAPKKGKIPLFDKLHDVKAGTPVGGGLLIIREELVSRGQNIQPKIKGNCLLKKE